MRSRHSHHRGYVLVVTLGLLVLASTMLVTLGRASVRHSLAARQAADELQRRWGVQTCRGAVLPHTARLLARREQNENRPVPSIHATIRLGNQTFNLLLADEQAKANVNGLLARSDRANVESRLRTSLAGTGVGNALILHPEDIANAARGDASANWISGPGQIFGGVAPSRLAGMEGASPMDRLTCWGNRSINLLRASEPALRLAAGDQLTNIEIGRLVQARDAVFAAPSRTKSIMASPGANASPNLDAVGNLLARARIDPGIRNATAFADRSSCYSTWVVARDRRRAWYYLFVRDESNLQRVREDSFAW